MATPKTLTLTDDRTQKAYELYGKAKVDAAIAKQAGVWEVVKAPSIGTAQKIVKNTDGSSTTTTSSWPVTTTTGARAEVKNNADFVENRINGGKTVTNTTTSNGKITKTYSDGTTETTDTAIIDTNQDVLDKQNVLLSETDKLDQDIKDRYAALQRSGDEAYNQLVANTQNMFASTRAKVNDSSKRFESKTSQGQYLNNGFRYTPQASEGMVYDAEQYGIARLADLDAQESQALQMALSAKNADDYAALQAYTDDVRSIQQDKINLLDKMTNQIKTIEETDKNIRNMNANEAKFMQSMVDSYILTAGSMDAAETEAYYDKKSKELSELMGFTVAPEFIKAQVEWANASAKLEVNKDLTTINGFYTDSLGRPLTDAEGKKVPFEKEDWGEWIEGNMLNVGTYDDNGNKVIKTYELTGGTKSYAETLADLPQTQTNVTITALSQAYAWPMPELLFTPDDTFVKTTNPAYKKIGNGGMQCAEFVNRIVGTSFESGKAAAKDDPSTLRVGSVASWAPAGSWVYEHAGIIIGEEGDNWIIKSANLRGNGIISTDTIPKSAIKWGYTPKWLDNLPNEVSGVYDPLKDTKLTPIGQNKDWSGIYLDTRTNQTISEGEAKSLYGSAVGQSSNQGIWQDPNLRSIAIGNIAFGKNMSDGEREAVLNIIKQYPKSSNQEIALLVKNMNVNDPKNVDKAIQYLDVFRNMKTPPAGYEAQIANLINKWDTAGLDAFVEANIERAVKEDVPADEFISRSSYQSLQQNVGILQGLIDRNSDKIGAFDGRVSDLLKKFKADPEYQQIKTLLSMSVADVRRKFAGSAVTETEMKALEDFIWGKTTWQESNLQTYLKSMMDKTTRSYENQRALYRKPDINTTYSTPASTETNTPVDWNWWVTNK